MTYREIRAEILEEITPNDTIRDQVIKLVEQWNKKTEACTLVLGGSLAKETHVQGTHDADVFAVFADDPDISDKLETVLDDLQVHAQRIHGSRDYFQAHIDDVDFEFVPVINIDDVSQAKNVTDASLLHVQWFTKHATKKIREEIRLAKAFFKAQRLYGAESYIGGFSGHVLDILIVHFGSLAKLASALGKHPKQPVFDIAGHYKNSKQALAAINTSKTEGPLLVVDPVDKERNAAASLTDAVYDHACRCCAELSASASRELFTLNLPKPSEWQKKDGYTYAIKVVPIRGKKDVVGGKLKKLYDRCIDRLGKEDLELLETDWYWKDTCVMLFRTATNRASTTYEITGPRENDDKEHVTAFKRRHTKISVRDGRFYAVERREHTAVRAILADECRKNEDLYMSFTS